MKKIIAFLCVLNTTIVLGQPIEMFDSYMNNFREIQSDTVSKNDFMSGKEISKELAKYFVPDKYDCECAKKGVWYRYASKMEKSDFIIAIISKDCDIT
jgi:hypothetical protein